MTGHGQKLVINSTCNCLSITGEFVAEELSSFSAVVNSWQPLNFEIISGGDIGDRLSDTRGRGLISTRNRKA